MNSHGQAGFAQSKQIMSGRMRRILAAVVVAAVAGALDARGSVVGSYDGFFADSETFGRPLTSIQGTLAVNVLSEDGRLTAKATVLGGPLNFRASAWDLANESSRVAVMTTRRGEKLTLSVLDDGRIYGMLEQGPPGGNVLEFMGGKNRFKDQADTVAQGVLEDCRGYFTMSLLNEAVISEGAAQASPAGAGYLTMTIGLGGRVKIAGLLADGTPVSQAPRLVLIGSGPMAYVPFFVRLYRNNGWASGILVIAPGTRIAVSPLHVCWDKPGAGPDGFQMVLEVCGGAYASPPSLAAGYLFKVYGPYGMTYYTPAGPQEYVVDAIPANIGVAASGLRMKMEKGVAPVKNEGGTYAYPAGNSSFATLTFTARTGVFKGKFNVYCDYTGPAGQPVHKKVRVSYAGVLTPMRAPSMADEPDGMGFFLMPDNDPSVAGYRLKRSFYAILFESSP